MKKQVPRHVPPGSALTAVMPAGAHGAPPLPLHCALARGSPELRGELRRHVAALVDGREGYSDDALAVVVALLTAYPGAAKVRRHDSCLPARKSTSGRKSPHGSDTLCRPSAVTFFPECKRRSSAAWD